MAKKKTKQKGYIHVYTGDGGGKTTAALGVAMRALGHGRGVAVVQFMKGRKDIGEWKIQKKLKDFVVYQFGRKDFVNLRKPLQKDIDLANQALGFAEGELFESSPPDLLILDEINLAAAIGLIDVSDVVSMLKKVPRGVDVYLTGRKAPKEFLKIADFVTVVEDKKRKKVPARKGIDY
ncbi:cob(I)yrinic acid a,c-diamide adenosyltransferase [Candidatus Woesearchaeota archaeon]|jgi:cob(I)alamin adenosyltransferase|nr:cob(I)yrinic acid a,c-diamide adenosyltransferase [Candidatus Woesearchaeota archaeon]